MTASRPIILDITCADEAFRDSAACVGVQIYPYEGGLYADAFYQAMKLIENPAIAIQFSLFLNKVAPNPLDINSGELSFAYWTMCRLYTHLVCGIRQVILQSERMLALGTTEMVQRCAFEKYKLGCIYVQPGIPCSTTSS
jgi:hypothetical protein